MRPSHDPGELGVIADSHPPMRVVVVGTSGAGKSTLAQRLSQALSCPWLELDRLYWGANWQPVAAAQFIQAVDAAAQGERWIADGNYRLVRELLWSRATHIVWLNFSRFTIFRRVLWRTLSRGLLRTRLSRGNRESLRAALFSKSSILRWSWTTFASNRAKYQALREDPVYAHLVWIELRRPSQGRAFLKRMVQGHNA